MNAVPAVMVHSVGRGVPDWAWTDLTVPTNVFEDRLCAPLRDGWRTIDLYELDGHIRGRRTLICDASPEAPGDDVCCGVLSWYEVRVRGYVAVRGDRRGSTPNEKRPRHAIARPLRQSLEGEPPAGRAGGER